MIEPANDDRLGKERDGWAATLLTSAALTALALFAVVILAAADVEACAVCYGDPASPLTQGLKMGILVLLGCIGSVLAGFASLFVYWIYRSRNLEKFTIDEGATS